MGCTLSFKMVCSNLSKSLAVQYYRCAAPIFYILRVYFINITGATHLLAFSDSVLRRYKGLPNNLHRVLCVSLGSVLNLVPTAGAGGRDGYLLGCFPYLRK